MADEFADLKKSKTPVNFGSLAVVLEPLIDKVREGFKAQAARIKEVETRNVQLLTRLDRQEQRLSAATKEIAALRKEKR